MNSKQSAFLLFFTLIGGFVLMMPALASAQESRLQMQIPNKAPRPAQGIEGSWNIRLQERRFENEINQMTTTEFRVGADLRYKPLQDVSFHLAPQFTYATGFTQTEEGQASAPATWGVKDASINANLTSYTLISAGALDQSEDHPDLLLSEQAFPALRLRLHSSEAEIFSAGMHVETAIPTSNSLSTQTRDVEKTPSFNSASLSAKLAHTNLEGELRGGYYQFQNLPSSVATKSTYLGNTTVSTTGGSDSEFRYDYRGPFAKLDLKAHFTRSFRLTGLAEWVNNAAVTTGLNQGTRTVVGAEIDASRNLQYIPSYEFFRIEPDAAVALYNCTALNTNRVGYNAGLAVAYKKKLKVSLFGGERDVVYIVPFQHRERTWNLKLETFDVAI